MFYIENIEIQNYRNFRKKIVLNLKPNPNKINEDLDLNYFVEKRKNNYMSTVNAIGGSNAAGKTNFISSIKILKRYFNDSASINALDHFLNKKYNEMLDEKKIILKIKKMALLTIFENCLKN